MKSRTERFRDRIDTERNLLNIVNDAYPMTRLHGLSRNSINLWRVDAVQSTYNKDDIDNITQQLLSLSSILNLEADTSRIVFDDKEIKDEDLHEKIKNLVSIIEALKC